MRGDGITLFRMLSVIGLVGSCMSMLHSCAPIPCWPRSLYAWGAPSSGVPRPSFSEISPSPVHWASPRAIPPLSPWFWGTRLLILNAPFSEDLHRFIPWADWPSRDHRMDSGEESLCLLFSL